MRVRYTGGALVLWFQYVIITSHRATFNGYKVLEVVVGSHDDWTVLQEFMKSSTEEVDVWHEPEVLGDSLHVLLQPSRQHSWETFCRVMELQCSVLIKDVEKLIDEELYSSQINSLNRRDRHVRSVTSVREELLTRLTDLYPTFEQIEQWLKDLNRTESLVTVTDIGKTYENRSLYVVKITGSSEPDRAPAMWIDTGIHSREWIAHTSGIYTITKLIEGYYENNTVRPLVENMIWYIMPVVNPDGYVYSHENNRFWRKNRSPPPVGVTDGYQNSTCLGTDLNRNWDFHWGEVGVSTNSCWVTYPGYKAKSELETQAIDRFILQRSDNIHGYITIHSYGQMFLTRWAFVNDTPSDHPELYALAKKTAESIEEIHGAKYRYGLSPRILYAYSGGSPDWAKGVADIKYSYSVELRDRGEYGFVLPVPYIQPVGEEIFTGLMVVGNRVMEYGKNISIIRDSMTTTTTTSATTTGDITMTAESDDVTTKHTQYTSGTPSHFTHNLYVLICTYLIISTYIFTVS